MTKAREEETQLSNASTSFTFLDLPYAIVISILSLLSVDSILACRCVCKSLLNLVSEDDFAELYLKKPPCTSIVYTNKSGYYLLQLGEGGFCKSSRFYLPSSCCQTWKLVDSCNGFIFLFDGASRVSICNPIRGEYVTVTVPRREEVDDLLKTDTYGFGFSPATNSYKVLRISSKKYIPHPIYIKRSDVEVLTVGTNKWRNIGFAPFPLNGQFPRANLNGALHWIVNNEALPKKQGEEISLLWSFDVGEERVRPITSPRDLRKGTANMSVGVLQNSLCIFDNSNYVHFDIWSMKDYGVAGSWTLDRILRSSVPASLDGSALEPIAVWKDGEILMKCGCGQLVSYDRNERIMIAILGTNDITDLSLGTKAHATDHASSFFPLKTMAMEGCLEIKKGNNATWI